MRFVWFYIVTLKFLSKVFHIPCTVHCVWWNIWFTDSTLHWDMLLILTDHISKYSPWLQQHPLPPLMALVNLERADEADPLNRGTCRLRMAYPPL